MNSILPETYINGYAETSFLVNGEEYTISVKLEELDQFENGIEFATTEGKAHI